MPLLIKGQFLFIYIMKQLAIILNIFISNMLFCQNLVNNPSFEVLSSCPTGPSHSATLSVGWLNPSQAGTPDVFNICCSSTLTTCNPYTYKQLPRTGDSFVGVWCTDPTFTVREYVHSQLTNTLVSNNFYYIKFFVVLGNYSKYACNNIGMYFSNNSIYQSGASNFLLNYTPQIKKFNNPIITDTLNWIEISGIYQSTGTENYVTVGNFNNDVTTDTLTTDTNNYSGSYYLLDDISVENITAPQWQYRDTTIYLGDSVLIGPAITGLNVDWFDMSSTFIKNAPGIYVKPIVTTPYQATETFNSVVYNHTVTVTVLMPVKVDEYDKLQNNVSIYPNPSSGNFSIQFDDLKIGDVEIIITDIAGRIVYQNKQKVVNTLSNFDLDVKNGLYFVKIINKDKRNVKKLVIQK